MPRRRFALFFGIIALLTSGFFGFEALLAGGSFHEPSIALDAAVPLRPEWIWVYLLYYPLCLLPLAVPGFLTDASVYRRVLTGFLVQFAVAWTVFYLYPTRMTRLPIEGFGPSALAVQGLYEVDGGHNILPSLHVANSFYMALLGGRFWPGWRARLLLLLALLITASTVLIKQHYLLDAPTGFLLGLLGYALYRGGGASSAASARLRPAS